jgi:hypothetical protein
MQHERCRHLALSSGEAMQTAFCTASAGALQRPTTRRRAAQRDLDRLRRMGEG